jgi:hypothetical protein
MPAARQLKQSGPALSMVVLLSVGVGMGSRLVGSPEPVWPNDASTVVLLRPVHAGLFAVAFRFPDAQPRSVTLTTGGQQGVIAVDTSMKSFVIRLPRDDAGQVVAQIDPPASVIVSRQPDMPERKVEWRPVRNSALQPNQPARNGQPGQASVNETDMLGVRTFGVPIRSGPHISDEQVSMAVHGDRLLATCWSVGDSLTTDLVPRPQDLPIYTSNLWFRVNVADGSTGFIPDVRFSRTDKSGRLSLPECGIPRAQK